MLPHAFGVLSRRSLIPRVTLLSTAGISAAILVGADVLGSPVRSLASLYSFGVLLTFTAAQVAVVRLRFKEPDLERPFRVPLNVRVRGVPVPIAALVGAPLTFAIWIAALATHNAARIAGPVWLLLGTAIFVLVRRSHGERLLEKVQPAVPDLVPEREGQYERILVPMKLGPIGEEVLATAIRLAEELGSTVSALHVVRVPLDRPLDAEMIDEEERAEASLAEAKLLASEHGVEVETRDRAGPGARRRDRAGGEGAGRRPDHHGLRAPLAPPVALLQPDRRLRAEEGAERGHGRGLPAGRSGGGSRGDLIGSRRATLSP